MLDVAIMIEGQDGLTWPRWQRLAAAAEELGYAGLYRSDHFSNPSGPYKDALDLWASLTWLASHTSRIEFGPLVSPLSFRNPVETAWHAAAVDDLSGGRLRLGLGAGWQEREHTNFGFDLMAPKPRFDRFAEGLQVVTQLLQSDQPTSFAGAYFQLHDALLLPRPKRPGGPPIVIGGGGRRRTLPLVVKYADEWNSNLQTPAGFAELNGYLTQLMRDAGRDPAAVRRTMMVPAIFGRTEADVVAHAQATGRDAAALRDRGGLVGTVNQWVEHLAALAEAGLQRVMIQWLEQDDIAGLETIAKDVLPQLAVGN